MSGDPDARYMQEIVQKWVQEVEKCDEEPNQGLKATLRVGGLLQGRGFLRHKTERKTTHFEHSGLKNPSGVRSAGQRLGPCSNSAHVSEQGHSDGRRVL